MYYTAGHMLSMDATDFDPYLKWLGIPQSEPRPINFYRLFGIALFENDPDVIAISADKQIEHLRRFSGGPHGELAERLVNELTRARLTLLNSERRALYDQQLRQAQSPKVAAAPALPPRQTQPQSQALPPRQSVINPGATQTSRPAAAFAMPPQPGPNLMPWMILGGVVIVMIGLIVALANRYEDDVIAKGKPPEKPKTKPLESPIKPKSTTITNGNKTKAPPVEVRPPQVNPKPINEPMPAKPVTSPPMIVEAKPPTTPDVEANLQPNPREPQPVKPTFPGFNPGTDNAFGVPATPPNDPSTPMTPPTPNPAMNNPGLNNPGAPGNTNPPGQGPTKAPLEPIPAQPFQIPDEPELRALYAEIERAKKANEPRAKLNRETYLKAFDIEINKIRTALNVDADVKANLIEVLKQDKADFESKQRYSIAPVMLPHNKVLAAFAADQIKVEKAYDLVIDRMLKDAQDEMAKKLKMLKDQDPDLRPFPVFGITLTERTRQITCYSNGTIDQAAGSLWAIDPSKRLQLSIAPERAGLSPEQFIFVISVDGRKFSGFDRYNRKITGELVP